MMGAGHRADVGREGGSSWVDALQQETAVKKNVAGASAAALEAKGDKLVAQGQRVLHGFCSCVFPAYDTNDFASYPFREAAKTFTLAKNWRKAAFAHHEYAICHMKMGRRERRTAAMALWDAAKCYKQAFNPGDKELVNRMECALNKAMRMLILEDELSLAGHACEELAELYAQQKQPLKAGALYKRAAECYGKSADPFCVHVRAPRAAEKAISYECFYGL